MSTLKQINYFSHFMYKLTEAPKDQIQGRIVSSPWAMHFSADTLTLVSFFFLHARQLHSDTYYGWEDSRFTYYSWF